MNQISFLERFAPPYSKEMLRTYGENKLDQHLTNLLLLIISFFRKRQNLRIILQNPLEYR